MNKNKGIPVHKAPAYAGPGRGPTIFGVMHAALPCVLHKRLFPGLEPTTFQSHK